MSEKKKTEFNFKKVSVRLVFIGVLVYSAYVLTNQQISMHHKQKTADECTALINEAKSENVKLDEELVLINSDEYKERKARELLGYIRPDERVYIDVTK